MKFKAFSLALVLAATAVFPGFAAAEEKETEEYTEYDGEVTVIRVATDGDATPYVFVDEDGKVTGYDVEVVEEVFSRLPQYELDWKIVEWTSIFPGVDSGYYDIVVDHLGYKKERAEKYLYSDVYDYGTYALTVRADNEEIKSIDDLGGKVTIIEPGSVNDTTFQQYNEAHPDNPVILTYAENTGNFPMLVSDGVIDFYYFTKITADNKIADMGLTDVITIPVPPEDRTKLSAGGVPGNFVVGSKELPEVIEAFNEKLMEAVEDGTIHRLREKYFNESEEDDVITPEFIESVRESVEEDLYGEEESSEAESEEETAEE